MIGLLFWLALSFVAYTYAGYPILLTLAARIRPEPRWNPNTPRVTLIIAAYNEERVLGAKLADVAALDYPPELMQVIVAADGSDDHTAEIAREHHWVEVVHRPERRGKMAALERAVEWANGDVLVFSDANNRYEPDAIRHLVAPFADATVGMVVGSKKVAGTSDLAADEGLYWRYESHLRRMESRLGCTVGVNGEILALRRELFGPAPAGTINDDLWLAQKIIRGGHDAVYEPRAVSVEPPSVALEAEAERRSRIVAGQLQALSVRTLPWRRPLVTWMLISHKMFRPLVPVALGVTLATTVAAVAVEPSGGLAALSSPWGAWSLTAHGAFAVLAAFGRRARRIGALSRFLAVEWWASLRGIWRHLRDAQPATWSKAERVG